jgi:phospholipase/carboxylesterase
MTNLVEITHHAERPAVGEGEPDGFIALFHGRGADEHDLVPLFDMLDPDRRFAGAAARGPLSLPPGGAHWYVVKRVGRPDPETFLPTYEAASSWLDGVVADHGVSYDRVILGGFSQGAVMSYALGLGAGRPQPAAILAFSGFLPNVDGFELDLDRPGLRVAIGHGIYDPLIEVGFGREAHRRLTEAGIEVLYRESPLPHAIDPTFVEQVRGIVAAIAGSADRSTR